MPTFTTILARHNLTPVDQALTDIDIPIITGPQRQGDVLIIPRPPAGAAELANMSAVPPQGVPVVIGEATGNMHLLQPDTDTHPVMWSPHIGRDSDVTLGVLHVPASQTAWLIHTDEHGVNGIGPGCYTLNGKREQAAEIRRVAD